jgi:hypothetical protein
VPPRIRTADLSGIVSGDFQLLAQGRQLPVEHWVRGQDLGHPLCKDIIDFGPRRQTVRRWDRRFITRLRGSDLVEHRELLLHSIQLSLRKSHLKIELADSSHGLRSRSSINPVNIELKRDRQDGR